MGAKIASFLATLLLSVPLAAIGLMAVFGVPELLPAGPQRDQVVRGLQNAFNWRTNNQTAQTSADPAYEDAVPFNPNGNVPTGTNSSAPAFGGNSAAPQNSGTQDSIWGSTGSGQQAGSAPRHWTDGGNPTGSGQLANGAMSHSGAGTSPALEASPFTNGLHSAPGAGVTHQTPMNRHVSAAPLSGPVLSWRQASSKLAELGIRNYHLERGSKEESFLFVCLFSPGDAPQVTHRFEAEADDPLTAVNQVLQQLDRWMQTRVPGTTRNATRTANAAIPGGTAPW